jgi:hypothetical protein
VAESDRIVALPEVPQASLAAPQPDLCGDIGLVHLIYDLERLPSGVPVVHVIDPVSQPTPAALVEFRSVQAVSWRLSYGESLLERALSRGGPRCHAAQEVRNSSWIRELERRHRGHQGSNRAPVERLRHFVITFPDSTLECAAEDLNVTVLPGGRLAALAECHRRHGSEPAGSGREERVPAH